MRISDWSSDVCSSDLTSSDGPGAGGPVVEPVGPARGAVLGLGQFALFGRRKFIVPALQSGLDHHIVPERRNQGRKEADEDAWHRNPLTVGPQFVKGRETVGAMIGMIGDLEHHHTRKRLEMVPDMARCDSAASDPKDRKSTR